MIDFDSLTVREIKSIQSLLNGQSDAAHPYQIGKNYFIRTVTHHLTGRLVKVTAQELVLEEAAWIADDGRFHDALKTGKLNEVEPFPQDEQVLVGRGSLIDAVVWKHALPKEQK